MSEATPTSSSHRAVLELPDSVRLSGTVSAEGDTHLVLRGVRMVGAGGGARLRLQQGLAATLRFDDLADRHGSIGETAVTIAGVDGNNLRLAPADDGAARCHQALRARATPSRRRASSEAGEALIDTIENRSLAELRNRFDSFQAALNDYLLDLSSRGNRGGVGANDIYDSIKILKRQREAVAEAYLAHIAQCFRDLTPERGPERQPGRENAVDTLDLVDLDEFENSLAVNRLIGAGRERHGPALECLTLRLAQLVGADPLALRLPVHVTELSKALHLSLRDRHISHDVTPRIFEVFQRDFIKPLDSFYAPLNQVLVNAGVLPGLEEEIRTKGSVLERRAAEAAGRRTPRPSRERPAPNGVAEKAGEPTRREPEAAGDDTGAPMAPEVLYQSVIDALNFRREFESGEGAAPGGERLADTDSVVDALASLQHDPGLRGELSERGSLSAYLADNSDRIKALEGTGGLTPDSLNQLDLVDNLFNTIRSQLDLSQRLRPALGELQVPLAKLALLEPRFFLDDSHAARAVVDKLSQLAVSGNFPNKTLEERVATIIDGIVDQYDRDSGVFDTALSHIDKLVEQQSSAHARNVERVVKTQEGQERLRRSRTQVDEAIRERLDAPEAPAVLLDLIEKGWRDLLVLTHLKDGPDSDAWRDHLRTLDLLAEWLNEQKEDSAEDMTVQRGLESDPFVDMLEQQITSELPANVELETVFAELREVLAGEKAVLSRSVGEDGFATPESPRQFRQRLAKTQRLRRWVERVEQLEPGTRLSYRDRQGERRRMELAWVNPDRDRFIFVNERGQKIADMNSVQLARLLSRGAKPPSPAENLSLVDQSMYGTLEAVQKSLSFSRNHDQLTRLINRGTFIDQVKRALHHANRKGSQHAVLHLNIDRFALVNEVYDHVAGDQVLAEFARLLAQLHGRKMSSARLGEDDFGILLVDHDRERALAAAEKIRADIESSSVDIDGELVSFTVSIGIAPIMEYSPDVDTVVQSAAAAVRQAKERGRNQVAWFEDSLENIRRYRRERKDSRQFLEQALATERFVLRAQPIVQTAVRGDRPASRHYEILLGLKEKDGSLVSPEKFIATAERHGFMTVVDRWVVREAFRWISQLMDVQKVVPSLAINLSGTSITDDAFMEYLFEQISEFGVGTNRLTFEITETGTITNLVKAADFVRAFRSIGCRFSLDDFGTGLASYNYLRELPVDFVKIDGTFITAIDENRNDYTMARSINDLAHFLGQETIAESVENDRIIVCLEEIGVDYLQGWGVGHPRPLDEIARELASLDK